MQSKKVVLILCMLLVGGVVGYYIAQSNISSTNQSGATVTYDKSIPPTEEQKKVIQALTVATYRSGPEALSGASLQKSLVGSGVGTGSADLLVGWCIGNSYWVYYWNVWYYWGVNGWTTWPGANPNGPCLYYNIDPYV